MPLLRTIAMCALLPCYLAGCARAAAVEADPEASAAQGARFGGTEAPISQIIPEKDLDTNKVALGRALFDDERLSSDGSVSCSSCHDLSRGGADGQERSIGAEGRATDVNTPSIFNSAQQFRQMRDGRASSVEAAIDEMIHAMMGSTYDRVSASLAEDSNYRSRFARLYPKAAAPISEETINDALATFVRSLSTPNARFDRYLAGQYDALDDLEYEGYELFVSLGCARCHQGAGAGGNLFHRIGKTGIHQKARTEDDFGRYNITGLERDRSVFRVPSLRNVALTAPYFHDGSAATLESAVEVLAIRQIGRPFAPEKRDALVAFLKTLTGEYDGQNLESGR